MKMVPVTAIQIRNDQLLVGDFYVGGWSIGMGELQNSFGGLEVNAPFDEDVAHSHPFASAVLDASVLNREDTIWEVIHEPPGFMTPPSYEPFRHEIVKSTFLKLRKMCMENGVNVLLPRSLT